MQLRALPVMSQFVSKFGSELEAYELKLLPWISNVFKLVHPFTEGMTPDRALASSER